MEIQVNSKRLTVNGIFHCCGVPGLFNLPFTVHLSLFTALQPWRCLWRGFLQITRTTRLRRTILQLRQILFTDASTFMSAPRKPVNGEWEMGNSQTIRPACRSLFPISYSLFTVYRARNTMRPRDKS